MGSDSNSFEKAIDNALAEADDVLNEETNPSSERKKLEIKIS